MKKVVRYKYQRAKIVKTKSDLIDYLAAFNDVKLVKQVEKSFSKILKLLSQRALRRVGGTLVPERFERLVSARRQRKHICNAVASSPNDLAKTINIPDTCSKSNRCMSGLCPVCERQFRLSLVRFVTRNKLRNLSWYMVTIIVKDWNVAPGELEAFVDYRDGSAVPKILKALSAAGTNTPVLAFGSVETVYKLISNKPHAKPFHIHLLVSGIAQTAIGEAIKGTGILCHEAEKPLDVRHVGKSVSSFLRAATYVCKQPLQQRRKTSALAPRYGANEFPYIRHIDELAANYGDIVTGDRWLSIGINYADAKFHLDDRIKLRVENKVKRIIRKAKARRVKLRKQ